MNLFEFFLNEIDPKFKGQIHPDIERAREELEKNAEEAIQYVRDSNNKSSDEVIEMLTGLADLDPGEIVKRAREADDKFNEGRMEELEDEVLAHAENLDSQVEAGAISKEQAREEKKRYKEQVKGDIERRMFVTDRFLKTLVQLAGRVGFTDTGSKATDKFLYRNQSLGFGKGAAVVNRASGRGLGDGGKGIPIDRYEAMKSAAAQTKTGDELALAYARPEEISPSFQADVRSGAETREKAAAEKMAAKKAAQASRSPLERGAAELGTNEMLAKLKAVYPDVLRMRSDNWEADLSDDKPSRDQFIRDLYRELTGGTTTASRAPVAKKPGTVRAVGPTIRKAAKEEAIDRFLREAWTVSTGEFDLHWSDDVW